MLASRVPSGYASTLPEPPVCVTEAWQRTRRPETSEDGPGAQVIAYDMDAFKRHRLRKRARS